MPNARRAPFGAIGGYLLRFYRQMTGVRLGLLISLLVASAAVWSAVPAVAGAQIRVVVQDFRGPQAASVRNGLVRNLRDEGGIEVVSRDELRHTAEELGIYSRSFTQDDYIELAAALEISAFIRGRVRRARRRWALTVVVINGEDGLESGRASWGGRTVSALRGIRRNGFARLEGAIMGGAAPAAAPRRQRPPRGRRGRRQPPQQQQQQEQYEETPQEYVAQEGGGQPWWAQQGGGVDESEAPPIRDEEEEDDDPVEGDARQTWLSFGLLLGSLRRSMQANADVAVPRNMPGNGNTERELRTYESAGLGHMEAGLEAEFWPGAVGAEQKIPWFGVVGSFRHSLFLTSFGCERRMDPADPCLAEIEVPTTQTDLYVGARGRYRLGDGAQAPEVRADLGYGQFTFELEPESLMSLERPSIIPPLAYEYVHLGLGGSYPVVPKWLTVGVHAAFRLGLGVGRPAQEVWGVETTETGGFLLGLDLYSDASYISEGVYLAMNIEYFVFTTTYRGQTACVDPGMDNVCYPAFTDPAMMGAVDHIESWEPWPHGADFDDVIGGIQDPVDDSYIRLSLAIGYALR